MRPRSSLGASGELWELGETTPVYQGARLWVHQSLPVGSRKSREMVKYKKTSPSLSLSPFLHIDFSVECWQSLLGFFFFSSTDGKSSCTVRFLLTKRSIKIPTMAKLCDASILGVGRELKVYLASSLLISSHTYSAQELSLLSQLTIYLASLNFLLPPLRLFFLPDFHRIARNLAQRVGKGNE